MAVRFILEPARDREVQGPTRDGDTAADPPTGSREAYGRADPPGPLPPPPPVGSGRWAGCALIAVGSSNLDGAAGWPAGTRSPAGAARGTLYPASGCRMPDTPAP